MSKYVTESDLAEELGVSTQYLAAVRKAGEGPVHLKLGRIIRYERESVDQWIENHTVRPATRETV